MTLIVVVLIVAVVLIAVLAWYSGRDQDRRKQAGWTALLAGETAPVRIAGVAQLHVPADAQEEARRLVGGGQRAAAVKVIRLSTDRTLRDCADIVDGLRYGYTFPTEPTVESQNAAT
jgi:type II secretory pathway component PulK